MVTLYSVGHSARRIEEFLGILHSAGVRRIVDVRTAPGSRKHPQFGKDELATVLEQRGIAYIWRKDLGGWRKPLPDSPHRALRSAGFRGYADYMDTGQFDSALRWLTDSSEETPTAFMCAESLWWQCHRRMIADALTVRGCTVLHLMTPGRSDAHRLHPAARLDGTRVIYDADQAEQPRLGD